MSLLNRGFPFLRRRAVTRSSRVSTRFFRGKALRCCFIVMTRGRRECHSTVFFTEASVGTGGCSGTRATVPNVEYTAPQIIPAIGRVRTSQTAMGSCHVSIINISGIDHIMINSRNADLDKLVLISTPHVGQRLGFLYGQLGTL